MRWLILGVTLLVAGVASAQQVLPVAPSLEEVLDRAGERVERFFARAQSIVCLETVRLQPLDPGFTARGDSRVVESELRLSWEPSTDGRPVTEARTLRQLLKVNGHAPRAKDWENCTAPEQQASEPQPLSMLLPALRSDYQFELSRRERIDGRLAFALDYRFNKPAEITVDMVPGRDDCVSFDLEGGVRGRLWVDAETFDVLRMDQRLSGLVNIPMPRIVARRPGSDMHWTLERWDTSIRFRTVSFTNPEESLVLPTSYSALRITRGSASPRLRTTTEYTQYRRFLTGGRVVGD